MGIIANATDILDVAIDHDIEMLAMPYEGVVQGAEEPDLVITLCRDVEATDLGELQCARSRRAVLPGKEWLTKYTEVLVHKRVSALAKARGAMTPAPESFAENRLADGAVENVLGAMEAHLFWN